MIEKDILTMVMTFLYTIGHFIGGTVVWLIQSISGVIIPDPIIDTIGLLVILTIFLALVDVAKKVIWIIVAVGWILIFIRIIMLMIGV